MHLKQEMFCKIIRDADKVDIFYEASEIFYDDKEIQEINQSTIHEEIINKIYQKNLINRNEINEKGKLISVLIMLTFLFDINYKASFEIIQSENYINKIFERFHFEDAHTRNKMKEVQAFLNQYIEEKIKG